MQKWIENVYFWFTRIRKAKFYWLPHVLFVFNYSTENCGGIELAEPGYNPLMDFICRKIMERGKYKEFYITNASINTDKQWT